MYKYVLLNFLHNLEILLQSLNKIPGKYRQYFYDSVLPPFAFITAVIRLSTDSYNFESSSVECCLSEHLLVALQMLKEGISFFLLSKTSHNGLIILKSGDLFGQVL